MIKRLLILAVALFTALPAMAEVDIQDITSPGGIKAWLVEEHSIPFLALEISFRGGTSLDAPDKGGATMMMTSLLEEGAGERNAQDFARRLEELAATFNYSADRDEITIKARILSENRDEAVALLRDSLIAPRFDPEAVERIRGQMGSVIRSNLTDPQKMASAGLSKLVYGDHPYAHPEEGTVESINALTRADLEHAHQVGMTRDKITVGAVGDITADELKTLLDTLLGDLPETGAADIADATLNLPGGVTVENYEIPQSVAIWMQKGLKRDDPDFFAAYVLNQVIGAGGFESRLMNEVREKRGLTYGVNTYIIDRNHALIWIGSMSSANNRMKEAIDVVRAEWQKIHDEGITEKELQDAKTYLTGEFALRFDGNARIAGIVNGMQSKDLPIDYNLTRNDKINAVTLDDIKRVAKRLMNPDELTFYVVGQPKGL